MPATERARTAKVIKLFKRPTNIARETLLTIINKYSQCLDLELNTANPKAKQDVLVKEPADLIEILETITLAPDGPYLDQQIYRQLQQSLEKSGLTSFAANQITSILKCGKAQDAKILADACIAVSSIDAVGVIEVALSNILISLFYTTDASTTFAHPQGHCVAHYLSRLIAFALISYEPQLKQQSTKQQQDASFEPRPAKMARPHTPVKVSTKFGEERKRITNALNNFLRHIVRILETKHSNGVSNFIYGLLEQISMTTASLETRIGFDTELASEVLSKLPEYVPKEIMLLLCDVTTSSGREKLADLLCGR